MKQAANMERIPSRNNIKQHDVNRQQNPKQTTGTSRGDPKEILATAASPCHPPLGYTNTEQQPLDEGEMCPEVGQLFILHSAQDWTK